LNIREVQIFAKGEK